MQDPGAATTFYCEKLGFAAAQGWEAGETWLSLPGKAGQLVEIEQKGSGAVFQLYLSVPNLVRTGKRLKALGLTAVRQKSGLSVIDPGGHRIVFVKTKPV